MAQKANHAATDGSVAVIALPGATVALVVLARVAIVAPGPLALVVHARVATVAPGHRVAQAATADLALKGGLMALQASLGIPRADLGATVLAVAPVVRISVRNPSSRSSSPSRPSKVASAPSPARSSSAAVPIPCSRWPDW